MSYCILASQCSGKFTTHVLHKAAREGTFEILFCLIRRAARALQRCVACVGFSVV